MRASDDAALQSLGWKVEPKAAVSELASQLSPRRAVARLGERIVTTERLFARREAAPDQLPEGLKPAIILLAVKPQFMDEALAHYRKFAGPGTTFLSIAAGKTGIKASMRSSTPPWPSTSVP